MVIRFTLEATDGQIKHIYVIYLKKNLHDRKK
jgi:hypothetical protein